MLDLLVLLREGAAPAAARNGEVAEAVALEVEAVAASMQRERATQEEPTKRRHCVRVSKPAEDGLTPKLEAERRWR